MSDKKNWTSDLGVCELFPVLTCLDRICGYQGGLIKESPSRPTTEQGNAIACWSVALAHAIEVRHHKKTSGIVSAALAKANVQYRYYQNEQSDNTLCSLRSIQSGQDLTKLQVYELIRSVEQELDAKLAETSALENTAQYLESVAQTALRANARVIAEHTKSYIEGTERLFDIKMTPVELWDDSVWGCSVADAGLLPAMTGFSSMFHDNVITMPNYRQWTRDSDFMKYRLKPGEVSDLKQACLGRVFRLEFYHCFRRGMFITFTRVYPPKVDCPVGLFGRTF